MMSAAVRRLRSSPQRAPLPFGRQPPAGRHVTGSLSAGSGCLDIAPSRLTGLITARSSASLDRVPGSESGEAGVTPLTGLRRLHPVRLGYPSRGAAPQVNDPGALEEFYTLA